MKALVLSVLAFALTIGSFGQDTLDARGPWSVGVSASLDRAYRTIRDDGGTPDLRPFVESREKHESPRAACGFGIDVHLDLSPRWILSSGIQFSDRGFGSYSEIDFIATDGVDPLLSGPSASIKECFHYQYVSLPFTARFQCGNGRFRFGTALGIGADLLTAQFYIIETTFSDGREMRSRETDRFSDYTRIGASAIFDIGCEISVARSWSIRVAPRARYQITPVADTRIIGHLYEIGGVAAVNYRL